MSIQETVSAPIDNTENENNAPWNSNGFQAYANSDYDYEDAELLAQLWDIPLTEAKEVIGHKIIHKIEDLLPQKLKDQYAARDKEGDHHYGNPDDSEVCIDEDALNDPQTAIKAVSPMDLSHATIKIKSLKIGTVNIYHSAPTE